MYIPSFNKFESEQEAIVFMQRYSFATIVTSVDDIPVATHLPFIVEQRDDKLVLSSHFAKANPQATGIEGKNALVIFTEPHAYISPTNYEKETNVPTWYYLAVHAYGKVTLLNETSDLLARTISNYEENYLQQWNNLTDDYKQKMMKGIVGFEIIVDDLQAKKKLSQNRSEQEKESIINTLSKSINTTENETAEYMKLIKLKH
ncbi:negative transcriptional regulator, PaiB family [Mucilaginibacter lappiensis]|uniref:Transcriptional regulator n=1 Tax=Mucilaginibacter lappiensis TaxID=354630 RepID=A0ABR6PT90_9SPHI|nr:FMN-binding negative transcriptional regulator [Mucilaginibacter lappiensis]MBB6113006.1 transcriptional regulator [Mucilaginibacter lappiensis]SIS10526.1 negative transcriptional regulator, PaiB family [Mucilaginibacter lappiensis]